VSLSILRSDVAACTVCPDLPLGPRPVVQIGAGARLVIIGQAPGTKVHASGVPWDDDSGDRLREWLGIPREVFYDPERVALVPMGFCYPGRKGDGDAPPRPECAPQWHERVLAAMPQIELTLLVGMYAQKAYLGKRRKKTLTATVQSWLEYAPDYLPTVHPTWRSRIWMKKNPWFEADVLPDLRARVARATQR